MPDDDGADGEGAKNEGAVLGWVAIGRCGCQVTVGRDSIGSDGSIVG